MLLLPSTLRPVGGVPAAGPVGWEAGHTFRVRHLGVQRLTLPSYLTLVGDVERFESFDGRIRRNERASEVLRALGFVGIVGTAVSFVGVSQARTRNEAPVWDSVAPGSPGGILVGFVGSGIGSSSARSLRADFRSPMDLVEAQRRLARERSRRLAMQRLAELAVDRLPATVDSEPVVPDMLAE